MRLKYVWNCSAKLMVCISNLQFAHQNTVVVCNSSSTIHHIHTLRERGRRLYTRVSKFYDIHTSRKLNSLVLRFCLWDVDLILSGQFHAENRAGTHIYICICIYCKMMCNVLCLIRIHNNIMLLGCLGMNEWFNRKFAIPMIVCG